MECIRTLTSFTAQEPRTDEQVKHHGYQGRLTIHETTGPSLPKYILEGPVIRRTILSTVYGCVNGAGALMRVDAQICRGST